MKTEKEIEKEIIQYLNTIGYAIKVQAGAMFSEYNGKKRMIKMAPSGTPDVFGCLNGRFIAIEVKKDIAECQKWLEYPRGKKKEKIAFDQRIEDQKECARQIKEAGGFFSITYSVEDLDKDLRMAGVIKETLKIFPK